MLDDYHLGIRQPYLNHHQQALHLFRHDPVKQFLHHHRKLQQQQGHRNRGRRDIQGLSEDGKLHFHCLHHNRTDDDDFLFRQRRHKCEHKGGRNEGQRQHRHQDPRHHVKGRLPHPFQGRHLQPLLHQVREVNLI